jgi:hypothetical protein
MKCQCTSWPKSQVTERKICELFSVNCLLSHVYIKYYTKVAVPCFPDLVICIAVVKI